MTKTSKRILAVMILIFTVLLIGCLVFTGKRIAGYPEDLNGYKRVVFQGKDDTMVAFTDKGAWYSASENEVILLEITEYLDGVITMKKNEETYKFVVIDKNTVYDETAGEFLTRRVGGNAFT